MQEGMLQLGQSFLCSARKLGSSLSKRLWASCTRAERPLAFSLPPVRHTRLLNTCPIASFNPLPAAFIKLASVDAAHQAIKALHTTNLGGRNIIVKSADQDCEYGENLEYWAPHDKIWDSWLCHTSLFACVPVPWACPHVHESTCAFAPALQCVNKQHLGLLTLWDLSSISCRALHQQPVLHEPAAELDR